MNNKHLFSDQTVAAYYCMKNKHSFNDPRYAYLCIDNLDLLGSEIFAFFYGVNRATEAILNSTYSHMYINMPH